MIGDQLHLQQSAFKAALQSQESIFANIFWVADQQRWMQTLLDYVMVSPNLRNEARDWRIWHPFDDPKCYEVIELREALLTASDHFPVTAVVSRSAW